MSTHPSPLLRVNLKALRLPTMLAEHEKLARDAAAGNQSHEEYLLRLTELELAARSANALAAHPPGRVSRAQGTRQLRLLALPSLNKAKILEMARCEWIRQRSNCCLVGSVGTGKTHIAISLGLAACRDLLRVRYFTAAALVNLLEEKQKQYQLDKLLGQLDRLDLLICDELGHRTFSRSGAELLFQVFADRYERKSLLLTSNLAFSEWTTIFHGERMTAALLDRLTHHCQIFEMNGESYRFRESMKNKRKKS